MAMSNSPSSNMFPMLNTIPVALGGFTYTYTIHDLPGKIRVEK